MRTGLPAPALSRSPALRLLALLAVLLPALGVSLRAQTPATLSFQGVLADAAGEALPDRTYALTFRLYEAAVGGEPVWTEEQEIEVEGGLFTARLGAKVPLNALAFDRPYWLGVSVSGTAELAPRLPLDAAPYSLTARRVAPGAVDGEALADGQVVRSLNGLTDAVTLRGSDTVLLSASDSTLTIEVLEGVLPFPFDAEVDVFGVAAFEIVNRGSASAARFEVDNVQSPNSAVMAVGNGPGATLFSRAFGAGQAAVFRNEAFSNREPVLDVFTAGNGATALRVNHAGSDGDLAVFQDDGENLVRFDKSGRGYFDGNVQTGGADVAEAVDVEGPAAAYGPGDVLVISTRTDRTFERSAAPYSTLVAGVVATEPGLVLHEGSAVAPAAGQVPLAVVGIVPTRVTAENGAIRRGDLLVTASTSGHAMRGTDRARLTGAVLGKALEPFEGPGTGLIRVLVNAQ